MKIQIARLGACLLLVAGINYAVSAAAMAADSQHAAPQQHTNDENRSNPKGPETRDLHLRSADGPFSIESLHGNVVVLFFGYTHCPDVCPRDMSIIAHTYDSFDARAKAHIKVVFVSLDPARDDTQTLKEFTQYFNPKFIGVTASPRNIKTLAKRFNIHYKKVPVKGSTSEYGLEHTANIYLLDGHGRISVILPNGISDLALQQAIKYLLEEQQTPPGKS